ncbi:MAG TPA: thioesterase family protein [Opitutaceae bacterium]|nr:thioesterase family protein [Opitutaceae bacterium]
MSFVYHRTVRFADTDAAGVVFFPNYLAICHEAYEESLAAAGIELQTFFHAQDLVAPVVKCQAEYLRPLTCGDKIRVTLTSAPLGTDGYAIDYEIRRLGDPAKLAARLRTEHLCIASASRRRCVAPPALAAWLKRHSQ